VGFALEDYTALRYIQRIATERGIGQQIALVPELDDPKDLFGLTASGRRRAVLRRAA
jgi:ornithine cyclodeaminase